jgi:hypothetical protein
LIYIQVNNTFERLNYFNGLTSKQKSQVVSGNKRGIVSLLQTSDNFQRQKKENEKNQNNRNIKTIANKDFINKLSDLLGSYNEEEEEKQERERNRKKRIYSYLPVEEAEEKSEEKETDDFIYPEKLKAGNFAQKYRNSIPGLNMKLLSDSSIMEKTDIIKHNQNSYSSISEFSIDKLIEEMKVKDAKEVTKHLFEIYNLSPAVIANGLKKGKFSAEDISGALINTFNANGEEIASDLKFADIEAKKVVDILKNFYEKNSNLKGQEIIPEIVKNLFSAEFSPEECGESIKSIFKLSSKDAAIFMMKAGYQEKDILQAMKNVFHIPLDKIVGLISDLFHLDKGQMKGFLQNAGYPNLIIHDAIIRAFKYKTAEKMIPKSIN